MEVDFFHSNLYTSRLHRKRSSIIAVVWEKPLNIAEYEVKSGIVDTYKTAVVFCVCAKCFVAYRYLSLSKGSLNSFIIKVKILQTKALDIFPNFNRLIFSVVNKHSTISDTYLKTLDAGSVFGTKWKAPSTRAAAFQVKLTFRVIPHTTISRDENVSSCHLQFSYSVEMPPLYVVTWRVQPHAFYL